MSGSFDHRTFGTSVSRPRSLVYPKICCCDGRYAWADNDMSDTVADDEASLPQQAPSTCSFLRPVDSATVRRLSLRSRDWLDQDAERPHSLDDAADTV